MNDPGGSLARQILSAQRPLRYRMLLGIATLAMFIGGLAIWMAHCAAADWQRFQAQRALTHEWRTAYAHVRATYFSAHSALLKLNRSSLPPCESAHIALMRNIVMGNPAVEEVGYFEGGLLRCTSWGAVPAVEQARHQRSIADYRTPTGEGASASLTPLVGGGQATALHRGPYNILMNPARLIPTKPPAFMELRTPTGRLIASAGPERADTVWGRTGTIGTATLRIAAPAPEPAGSGIGHWLWLGLLGLGVTVALTWLGNLWIARHLSPLNVLTRDVAAGELHLVYQPIVELATGRCAAVEVLLRWRLRDGTYANPEEFVALAEAAGQLPMLTRYVMAKGLAEAGALMRQNPGLSLSINVGAADLADYGVLTTLNQQLERQGLQARRIWLELTERTLLDQQAELAIIDAVAERGYILVADDFGTGYSGLRNLNQLPIQVVKLDKTFTSKLATQTSVENIEDIVAFVQSRALALVAEGVETRQQQEHLVSLGVQYGQGWLFGKPMTITHLRQYVDSSTSG